LNSAVECRVECRSCANDANDVIAAARSAPGLVACGPPWVKCPSGGGFDCVHVSFISVNTD
jgi:hypothetical protein